MTEPLLFLTMLAIVYVIGWKRGYAKADHPHRRKHDCPNLNTTH